jgi:hypothetical protein
MNRKIDRDALLAELSKRYVAEKLGIDPRDFKPTADAAWVGIAARALKTAGGKAVALSY